MIKYLDKTAKTEDEAIALALQELGLDRDEVSVEVLERSKSGFLGIGSSPAVVRVSYDVTESKVEKTEQFLAGLFEKMEIDAQLQISEDEEGSINVELAGENIGSVIGRRGEMLDAIQHLANYAVNHGESGRTRISIDAENYRAKRVEALEKLAQKVAGKAVKYRRNVTLEPMNAYERHIIHAALQDYPGVTTYSTGSEPNRRIVVAYERTGAAPRERTESREPHRDSRDHGRGGRSFHTERPALRTDEVPVDPQVEAENARIREEARQANSTSSPSSSREWL